MNIDVLLKIAPISIVFTCFSVAGVTHSINLIDGFHGIASMIGIFILSAIIYVAFKVSDMTIVILGISVIGAILGFFVLNYPKGLIFLGDSGAYLIGFWISLLSLLLVNRHEEVSDWFPLLLCFYPIFETIFTIFRRYCYLSHCDFSEFLAIPWRLLFDESGQFRMQRQSFTNVMKYLIL